MIRRLPSLICVTLLCAACSTPPPAEQTAIESGKASVVPERVVSGLFLMKVALVGTADKPSLAEVFAFSSAHLCPAGYQEIPLAKNSVDAKEPVQFAQLAKAQGKDAAALRSKIVYVLCNDSPFGYTDAVALIRERVERD